MLETFAQLGLQPGATSGELTAAIAAIPQAERAQRRLELFGTTRAFFGSTRERQARLALMDGQGRNRILI